MPGCKTGDIAVFITDPLKTAKLDLTGMFVTVLEEDTRTDYKAGTQKTFTVELAIPFTLKNRKIAKVKGTPDAILQPIRHGKTPESISTSKEHHDHAHN